MQMSDCNAMEERQMSQTSTPPTKKLMVPHTVANLSQGEVDQMQPEALRAALRAVIGSVHTADNGHQNHNSHTNS